jgi:hypothetical protein
LTLVALPVGVQGKEDLLFVNKKKQKNFMTALRARRRLAKKIHMEAVRRGEASIGKFFFFCFSPSPPPSCESSCLFADPCTVMTVGARRHPESRRQVKSLADFACSEMRR